MVNNNNSACTPDNHVLTDLVQSFIGQMNPSASFQSSDIFTAGSGAGCLSDDAQFFIQYSCVMSQDQQDAKFRQISLYVCIAVFVALFYYLRIRHLIEKTNIDYLEWDLATVTAADYTVERTITKTEYDAWLVTYKTIDKYIDVEMPVGLAFKKYLKDKIENEVTQFKRDQNRRDDEEHGHHHGSDERSKIAHIVLSFDNRNLLSLLQKRGDAISQLNFNKVRELDQKIGEEAKNWQQLTRPCDAFITFDLEEDYNAAIEGGYKQAPEPTDIIWENRANQGNTCWYRSIIANIVVFFILVVFFFFTFKIRATSADVFDLFPETNCDNIFTAYGDQLDYWAVADYELIAAWNEDRS